MEETLVEVFGDGGGRYQELARGRRHDSCQNRGPDEARYEGREEVLVHDEEDPFYIGTCQWCSKEYMAY